MGGCLGWRGGDHFFVVLGFQSASRLFNLFDGLPLLNRLSQSRHEAVVIIFGQDPVSGKAIAAGTLPENIADGELPPEKPAATALPFTNCLMNP